MLKKRDEFKFEINFDPSKDAHSGPGSFILGGLRKIKNYMFNNLTAKDAIAIVLMWIGIVLICVYSVWGYQGRLDGLWSLGLFILSAMVFLVGACALFSSDDD